MSVFQTTKSKKKKKTSDTQTVVESEPRFDGHEREAGVQACMLMCVCHCFCAGRSKQGREIEGWCEVIW